ASGPSARLELEPLDQGAVEGTKDAFFAAVNRGESNKADHHFLCSWHHMLPVEALDILLTVAIPKNVLDDHYFVFPALTFRAIEWMGRDYLPVLMRPAVRYVSRFPLSPGVPEIEALLDEYQLLTRPLLERTGDDETPAIGRLGEAIGACDICAYI